MTGKPHPAWVCAWPVAWLVVLVFGDVWWGWENCMCVLSGLLMLDLRVGGGLDGVGEEVVGVVSC